MNVNQDYTREAAGGLTSDPVASFLHNSQSLHFNMHDNRGKIITNDRTTTISLCSTFDKSQPVLIGSLSDNGLLDGISFFTQERTPQEPQHKNPNTTPGVLNLLKNTKGDENPT